MVSIFKIRDVRTGKFIAGMNPHLYWSDEGTVWHSKEGLNRFLKVSTLYINSHKDTPLSTSILNEVDRFGEVVEFNLVEV